MKYQYFKDLKKTASIITLAGMLNACSTITYLEPTKYNPSNPQNNLTCLQTQLDNSGIEYTLSKDSKIKIVNPDFKESKLEKIAKSCDSKVTQEIDNGDNSVIYVVLGIGIVAIIALVASGGGGNNPISNVVNKILPSGGSGNGGGL